MCNCYYLCKKCEAHGKHPEHVLIGIPYNSDASNVTQPGPSTSTPNSNKTPSKKHSTAKRFAEHFGITLAAKLALTGLMAAFGLESLGDILTDPGGGDGSMK
uniref:Uncharacterized protein n=1 Tax=Acrobeloides nanus TaxID=290746 RepID=A0A914E601_9BILA